MDDYTLEKLTVKPAKLSPTFNSKVFEYSTTVSTNVAKVTADCLTNDTGASYQIKGNKGSKVVELAEGRVTEIDIEVTSEDGTVGHYVIKVKRLSGKDASLSALSVDRGHLSPEFDGQHDEYWVSVPIVETEVLVTATPPDAKCQLSVGGKAAGEKTTLNIGDTLIEVTVGSIDGTVTKTYKLYVTRPAIPRFIKISDPKLKLKFEDPFSLAPFYQPISIRESDPRNTFSAPIITELTRTNKYDPISQLPLPSDWIVKEFQLDKELSDTVAVVPLSYGGSTEGCPIRELPANLSQTNVTPKHVEVGAECTSLSIKHTYELRPWEKNLQQIFDESNPMKLMTRSKDSVKHYLAALPATPGSNHRWPENQHPLDHISHAAQCLATAIKAKKTDANSHLQLGLVLEERYLAEDMFNLKSSVGDGAGELATLNVQVKAGSKEEEIAAICKIHGVDEKAPLSLVLKALDTEYQAMKNAGNTAKAEQVQSLFAWKNKQATQEGAAAQKAAEDTNPLGQAYLKYLDALSCDETKSIYHFHVGRLQVVQGLYDEAVTRLQSALSWNKQHQMARFYLGLALSLRTGGPQARAAEAFAYIQEAIELLLAKQTNLALAPETGEKQMLVEDLLRLSNVHILRGIISLGKMIQSNPEMAKNCMSAEDLYHTAALLSTTALPTIARGDLYKQMEWVVLDAHSLLLDIMLARADDPQHIVKRCQGLSAFIRCATIGENPQLAALQLKTSKALVSIQPSSSQALYLLGVAQLAMFDLDPKGERAESLLEDCKRSLRASIEMEGKSTHSDLPSDLKEQVWWKEKQSSSIKESTKEEPSSAPATRGAPSRGRGTTAGRGTAAPRGSPAARGAAAKAAPVKPAANQKSQQTASSKATAAAKPAARGAAAARGTGRGAAKATAPAPTGTNSEAKNSTKVEQVSNSAPADSASSLPPTPKTLPAVLNRMTYHARLALARAFNREEAKDETEAEKYYQEVMVMAPEVHDAYIELADMKLKSDPLGAVDIYCKFPVPEEPSFDDAYIFGEIVLLLFKHEKYDHPHLADNMIRLGRIMGIGYLDKYVKKLEEKYKNDLLKKVYAGVNRKSVDDPDMIQFFKFKYWD